MNGSSLTTSAGMAENEPSLRHRVSAHTTPHDTTATVHKYPIGISSYPRCGAIRAAWTSAVGSARNARTRSAFPGDS